MSVFMLTEWHEVLGQRNCPWTPLSLRDSAILRLVIEQQKGRVATGGNIETFTGFDRVGFYRAFGDIQFAGNFLAAFMTGNQAQDLPLTRGQPFNLRRYYVIQSASPDTSAY